MVIIHFGGLATGSARLYADYDDIATSFVSQGLVVGVIQYRLGVHGKNGPAIPLSLRGAFRPPPTPSPSLRDIILTLGL